jgi:cytidylate kinase
VFCRQSRPDRRLSANRHCRAPLKSAADAHELDTTRLKIDEAVAAAVRLVEANRR